MHESDIHSLERFVAENDDLFALEERIGRFNIFDALSIERVEIRHSNFLAWLLCPSQSHAQGDMFLRAVLMDILRKARQQGVSPPISPIELDGSDLRGVKIDREWRNIDLLITCQSPPFVVAIENKIDSGEHSNQLNRYKDVILREYPTLPRLHLFLTPDGDEASDDEWVTYSYADLYQSLSRARNANAKVIGGDVQVFLDHYLSLIGNRFMENPELDRLCRQIYSNHRRALELIWERAGSPSSAIVARIEESLRENAEQWLIVATKPREVEFIPASWSNMLPPIGKRKTFNAGHWITVRLRAGATKLHFMVVVCPTTAPDDRKRVVDRILANKSEFGFSTFFKKKELTTDWTRVLSESICPLPEDEEPDLDGIMQKVQTRLSGFLEKTASLPDAIKQLGLPMSAQASSNE